MPAVAKTKPMSTHVEPIAYKYTDGSLPPEASRDALELLLEWRGTAAIEEVDDAIRTLTTMVQRAGQQFLGGQRSVVSGLKAFTRCRGVYVRRRRAIEEILGLAPSEQPAEDIGDVFRVVANETRPGTLENDLANALASSNKQLLATAKELEGLRTVASDNVHYRNWGTEPVGPRLDLAVEEVGRAVRRARRLADPRIKEVDSLPWHYTQREFEQLKWEVANFGSRSEAIFAQDRLLAKLNEILARRGEDAARVSILTDDLERVRGRVGKRVKKAIKAAGGDAVVIEAVVAARALQAPPRGKAADDAIAAIDADLKRLADAGTTTGPAVESLKAKRADVVQGGARLKAEIAQQARTAAAELLISAVSGTESSRAELERLSANTAAGWPPGFNVALAAARGDLATVAELS